MERSASGSSAKLSEHLGLVQPAADGPDDVVAHRDPIREDDPQQRVTIDDEVPRRLRAGLGAERAGGDASARCRLRGAPTRSRLRRRARDSMRLPPMSSQCRVTLERPSALGTYRLVGRFSLCRHFPNALLTRPQKHSLIPRQLRGIWANASGSTRHTVRYLWDDYTPWGTA